MFDTARIVAAVANVARAPCALHAPEFLGNEWAYVKDCLDTGWVSSVGSYVDRFEHDLAALTGVQAAIATVNGTAALHVCLLLAGVVRDDEVIVPALTFVATANAVAYCGAVPHFGDCARDTLGLDPVALDIHLGEVAERRGDTTINRGTGRPIRAVVCMHAFGHPADLDLLAEVCARWHLVLIEDAAESLGSTYKGRHTGTVGRLAALSFNGNKIITTGGGGAVLTSDPALAREAKHLTTTAKMPHRWEFYHDRVAFNYRMPNINAALGCAQLETLDRFVAEKRALAVSYVEAFRDVPGGAIFTEAAFSRSNYWLNAFILDEEKGGRRDEVLAALNDAGLMSRPVWTPLHRLPMFAECPRAALQVTEAMERQLINLPSSAKLVRSED